MRTGWPGVSMVFVGEIARYFVSSMGVAANTIVEADVSSRHAHMLLGHKASNQQTQHMWTVDDETVCWIPLHECP